MNLTAKDLNGNHLGKTVSIHDGHPYTGTLDETGINQHGLVWVDITQGSANHFAVLNPNTPITIQEEQ